MTETGREGGPCGMHTSLSSNTAVIEDEDIDSTAVDIVPTMTEGARSAADAEREMTIRFALRTCRKGLFWSLAFTTAIIMEGFDLALLSGFYAFSAFRVGRIPFCKKFYALQ